MDANDKTTKYDPTAELFQCSSDYIVDVAWKESSVSSHKAKNINAAIIWGRMSIGVRIVDLTKNRFDEALKLIKEQFFVSEPMCKATLLSRDNTSIRTYLNLISVWMSEMQCICAIHEGSGKLVGIAVATVNKKADQSMDASRISMSQGEAIFKILSLKSCLFGMARLYDKYEINEYFRLHLLCVDSAFQNMGIGTDLMRSCVDCSRRLQMPACIGAFSSGATQTIAERLGFETLADIPYKEYVPPENVRTPFFDVAVGNYSIACMGLRTPVPKEHFEVAAKTTSTTPSSKQQKKKGK